MAETTFEHTSKSLISQIKLDKLEMFFQKN